MMVSNINQIFYRETNRYDDSNYVNDHKYFNQTSSISINKGRFLGTDDHVIISGNQYNSASVYAFYGVDKVANISLNDRKSYDMELIGIARTSQTFAVLNSINLSNKINSLELINLESSIHSTSMNLVDRSLFIANHTHHIASMSFFSDYELLAVGTDSGYVILFDLFLGSEVHRFKADSCGVTKVKFTKAGNLITVGLSNKNQIKIWDLKSQNDLGQQQHRPVITLTQQLTTSILHSDNKLLQSNNGISRNSILSSSINCISMHPLSPDKLVSGDQQGQVLLWDLRSEGSIAFKPHQKQITDLLFHPQRHDTIISSSVDGSVRSLDVNQCNAKKSGVIYGDECSDSAYTILHTSCSNGSITSLDVESSSSNNTSSLLAVSNTGEITKMKI